MGRAAGAMGAGTAAGAAAMGISPPTAGASPEAAFWGQSREM